MINEIKNKTFQIFLAGEERDLMVTIEAPENTSPEEQVRLAKAEVEANPQKYPNFTLSFPLHSL